MAAVLACGPDAVLSHRAAAALHGLRRAGSGGIDVTATRKHNIGGIRCHFARTLDPRDVTVIDGIPVTTLERTLLDSAEVLSPRQLSAALERRSAIAGSMAAASPRSSPAIGAVTAQGR